MERLIIFLEVPATKYRDAKHIGLTLISNIFTPISIQEHMESFIGSSGNPYALKLSLPRCILGESFAGAQMGQINLKVSS